MEGSLGMQVEAVSRILLSARLRILYILKQSKRAPLNPDYSVLESFLNDWYMMALKCTFLDIHKLVFWGVNLEIVRDGSGR